MATEKKATQMQPTTQTHKNQKPSGGNGQKTKVFSEQAAEPENTAAEPAESTQPAATPAQKRAAFDAVFAAEKGIRDAEEAVKAASNRRSDAVKALIQTMSGKLGPWKVDGQLLRARVRGDSAYLLRPDDLDVEVI